MDPSLTAGLLGAVGEEHPVALIKGEEERRSGIKPPFKGPPEVRDAAAAIGREGEEVGDGGLLEAEDCRCLPYAGERALTAGAGGRIAPHHQQRPVLSHQVSLVALSVVPGSDTCVSTLDSTQSHKHTSGGIVMTEQHPKDTLQADLEALAEVFEAEDLEDRRAEAQRRREGLPEPKRDIRTFDGFASGGAAPRA